MRTLVCALLLCVSLSVSAQSEKEEDPWRPLRYFIGSWQGTGTGKPGASVILRDYQFVLDDAFIRVRSESTYAPQEKNPEGEVHKEWGMISYDRDQGRFVLRQFHNETIVNLYVLEQHAPERQVLVFTTESMENFLTGWKARETYKILNENEFTEVFELAPPGKDFSVFVENHFTRDQ